MGLYNTLTSQGVKGSDTVGVQKQLYGKLIGDPGTYTASASQNIALEKALGGRKYTDVLGGTASSGTVAPPPPAPPVPTAPTSAMAFAQGQNDQLQGTYSSLLGGVNDARTKLINYYSSLENPMARYDRVYKEQGIGDQQATVDSLTKNLLQTSNLMEDMPASVKSRVGDFVMDEGDRASLLSRELQPLQEAQRTQSRSLDLANVGLQGKYQALNNLIALASQSDAQGAKPYELGVNYASEDLSSGMGVAQGKSERLMSAFNQDTQAAEARRQAEENWQHQLQLAAINHKYALDEQSNSARLSKSASDKTIKDMADNTFNQILGGAQSEYDVYAAIQKLKASGADPSLINELMNRHAELKARVGLDGPVREGAQAGGRYSASLGL